MPQVTAIEPQKKKSDRFNIFVDNKFAFALDEINLADSNLKVGQNLKDQEIKNLAEKNKAGKLLDAVLKFLSYRPRSVKETEDYLAKKIAKSESIKFKEAQESPQIKNIVRKLKKYKYLDDYEFAKWLVKSRIRSNTRGIALIKMELKQKGIDRDIIENLRAESIDESKLARLALAKRIAKWQKLPQLELKKKVYQYLASRGFTYETIKEAFANLEKKD